MLSFSSRCSRSFLRGISEVEITSLTGANELHGWNLPRHKYFAHIGSASILQLRTTKANQLSISGTRFFGKNLTADLKPDGQKELKNGVFMLFPRILAAPNFWAKFSVYIMSIDSKFSELRLRQLPATNQQLQLLSSWWHHDRPIDCSVLAHGPSSGSDCQTQW